MCHVAGSCQTPSSVEVWGGGGKKNLVRWPRAGPVYVKMTPCCHMGCDFGIRTGAVGATWINTRYTSYKVVC